MLKTLYSANPVDYIITSLNRCPAFALIEASRNTATPHLSLGWVSIVELNNAIGIDDRRQQASKPSSKAVGYGRHRWR